MKKEEISIIVPIYNVEKYVEKCLKSLINQTYKKIKIYAIIDGSPDNSAEIVKKYAKKDDRILFVEKENGGYGSVLQYAIDKIDTEYFAICDPDDWLEVNAIETLYKTAIKYDSDIVIGDKYNVYEDSTDKKIKIKSNLNHEYVKPNHLYENNDVSILAMLSPSPHSKLYRTNLAKDIKFPKKVNYTDFLLYLVVLSKAKKGIYIHAFLSNYLIDRCGNTETDKSLKNIKNQTIVFEETYNQISKNRKNEYIYYKLYEQCRYTYVSVLSHTENLNLKEINKELSCITLLAKQKSLIKNCLKETGKGKLNNIVMNLLFNNSTRLLMYSFLISLRRKNDRKS